MKKTLENIIYFSLVVCYTLAATVGNVIVLKELLNSGDKRHQLASEKTSRSIPDTPVWSVKTHTTPALQSDISVHLGLFDEILSCQKSPRIYVYTDFQSKYTYLESLPSKPRDPPII